MRNRQETLDELVEANGQGCRHTAIKAKIGRTSLWRWCNGLSFPQHAQASALATALSVDVERVLAAAEASRELATAS